MIKVIDDYYITVESSPVVNYTVRKGNCKTDAKGSNRDRVLGHGGSMEDALKIVRKHITAERLEAGSPSLSEALRTIKEVNAEMKAAYWEQVL